jgi:hypothetical protein
MNLETLIDKYPSERRAIIKLGEVLGSGEHEEFTLNRLTDLVHPTSIELLAGALGELVRSGKLRLVVRVISPSTHGGIADFDSLDEVPDVIHDWRTDREVEVKADDLRVLYLT